MHTFLNFCNKLAVTDVIKSCWSLIISLLVGLGCVLAVGLIPVNRDFRPDPNGIEIFIYSDEAHSEFIFPTVHPSRNWKVFFGKGEFEISSLDLPYVGLGWGEKVFFVETPTWSDVKFTTTVKAMFVPSASAVKVAFQTKPETGGDVRKLKISQEQYQKLIQHVDDTILIRSRLVQIKGASHDPHSRFFEANGSYHLFWTCNAWLGNGMKKAGIKVGNYTPLPQTVFWNLPK